jgi:hypothetical protein
MQCSRSASSWLTLCLAALVISLGGCVEQSMVIKVKRDGSGVIQLRTHQQKLVLPFANSASQDETPEKPLPTAERLAQITTELGDGVKLVSARESTNRSGWQGYDLVWEFNDINQITLSDRFNKLLNEKGEEEDHREQAAGEAKAEQEPAEDEPAVETLQALRFTMQDGLLEIQPIGFDQQESAEKQVEQIGTADPFAGEPVGSPGTVDIMGAAAEEIAIKLLSEARFGLFIEVDGEIEATNAKHRKGNLITLMKINAGELLENPETRERIKQLGTPDKKPSLADLQTLAEMTEGLDLDLQNPLRIKIR